MEQNKVSVGITSIIGWATALLALLPAIIKSIEAGQVAFNGPEKYLAITGIATGLITQIGRYLQAHKMIGTSESNLFNEFESKVPAAIEAIRPQSSVKPDGPTEVNSNPVAEQNS